MSSGKNRPSWNEYFKKIVIATSERSACDRLNVGCLLVKENRIISQGYNGFLRDVLILRLFEVVTNKQQFMPNKTHLLIVRRGPHVAAQTHI